MSNISLPYDKTTHQNVRNVAIEYLKKGEFEAFKSHYEASVYTGKVEEYETTYESTMSFDLMTGNPRAITHIIEKDGKIKYLRDDSLALMGAAIQTESPQLVLDLYHFLSDKSNQANVDPDLLLKLACQNGQTELIQELFKKKYYGDISRDFLAKNSSKEIKEALQPLFIQLHLLRKKDNDLFNRSFNTEADALNELRIFLIKEMSQFAFENKIENLPDFKKKCQDKIKETQGKVHEHRGVKKLLAGLLTVLDKLGVFSLTTLINEKATASFFRPKTDTESLLDNASESIEKLSIKPK